MKKIVPWCVYCAAILVALPFGASNVLAQSYPAKPVKIVVNMVAGGAQDLLARAIGKQLSQEWNKPVIIENRPGAGGNIGANDVAKAAPDGYTLLLTTSNLAISPSLYHKLPFNPRSSFAPISQLTSNILVLVANAKVPAKNIGELVKLAKAEPGKLNYGYPGVGTMPQLAMELLKKYAHINIVGIPYRGMAPISTALVANRVNLAFMALNGPLKAYMKAGKLRPLVVSGTGMKRSPLLPNVPTMMEARLRNFQLSSWYGLFAPAGTPKATLEAIQRATKKALNTPDVKNRVLPVLGVEPVASSVRTFDGKYQKSIGVYSKIVKDTHIPLRD